MRQSQHTDSNLPILYSLQHCPYAMRARLGLLLAEQVVSLRAITMDNKPEEMLLVSPKGTVPVLVVDTDTVVDESLDIMLWALQRNDPHNLLYADNVGALAEMLKIIEENDREFKPRLEKYKRSKRFHNDSEAEDRLACEPFIQRLELRLATHEFLMGTTPSLLDYALLPFVRQFSKVNRQLFREGPYRNLQRWLNHHLQSRLFARAMLKYPFWLESGEAFLFGSDQS